MTINIKPGSVPNKRNVMPSGETFAVDTSNILFICSGAFMGLEKAIQDRIGAKNVRVFSFEKFIFFSRKYHMLILFSLLDSD